MKRKPNPHPHRCEWCKQPLIPSRNLYTGTGWAHVNGCPEPKVSPGTPAYWREGKEVLFISDPKRIGKTYWRLVAYAHPVYGNCTEYEWLNETTGKPYWAKSNEHPRYNSNDTYDGLPKSLVNIWNENLAAVRYYLGEAGA